MQIMFLLPQIIILSIFWVFFPPWYDRIGGTPIGYRLWIRKFDRGKCGQSYKLGVYHRRFMLLTAIINVEGSHAWGFPSTIWGSRRYTDMQHRVQELWHDTIPPYYGPITAGVILILSMVYVVSLVIKSFLQVKHNLASPQSSLRRIQNSRMLQQPSLSIHHSVLNSHVIASLSSSVTDQWENMLNFSYEDITTIVVDNSATGHIINDSKYFVEELEPAPHTHVATIGKDTHKPLGKATARILFKDNDGISHTIDLQNAYYFPDSPVNVMSVTALAEQLDDDEGTWIQTCRHKSTFQWDHGKYQRCFYHPLSGLPELPLVSSCGSSSVSDKFSLFVNTFNSTMSSFRVNNFKTRFMKDDNKYQVMQFHPDEDECDEMHNGMGASAQTNEFLEFRTQAGSKKNSRTVAFSSDMEGSTTSTQGTLLAAESSEQAHNDTSTDHIAIQRLYDLQDEFLLWHEKLNHIPFSKMMNLAQRGFLPKKFLKLKSSLPPCGVCLFGQAKKRSWRTKAHPRTIRDDKDTKPGAGTSVDQLISHQVLVLVLVLVYFHLTGY